MQPTPEAPPAATPAPSDLALTSLRALAADLLATLTETGLAFDGVKMLLGSPATLCDFSEAFLVIEEHPAFAEGEDTPAAFAHHAARCCGGASALYEAEALGFGGAEGAKRRERNAREEMARCARAAVDGRLAALLRGYGCVSAERLVVRGLCGLGGADEDRAAVVVDVARLYTRSASRAVAAFLAHRDRPLVVLRAMRVWGERCDIDETLRVFA